MNKINQLHLQKLLHALGVNSAIGVTIILLCLCLLLSLSFAVAPCVQADSPRELFVNLSDVELPQKGHHKLESVLSRLAMSEKVGEAGTFARQAMVDLVDGKVRVVIEVTLGGILEAGQAVECVGGKVEASYRHLIQAVIPVSGLTTLADNPYILFVRLPLKAVPATISEGANLIGADDWNSVGWTGTDVKVAILDIGFDGYNSLLGTELPSFVTTRSFRSDGDITGGGEVHGTACAEIIYDIAPDADFYLVNFYTAVELGNAVDWLIAQGVDIISCSIGWPIGGPGDGTGLICDMVEQARIAATLWLNSAGNCAQQHWMGSWLDTNGDGWHEFEPAVDSSNTIGGVVGYPVNIYLMWDDPWGASNNDYDLYVFDQWHNLLWWSVNDQAGGYAYPVESIADYAPYTGIYHVRIHMWDADGTAKFHLFTPDAPYMQYQVLSTSLTPPADSASAMTVGAVHWNHPGELESFSSHGPTTDNRVKPDLVAPDGVSTASYGTSDGLAYADGGSGFFGTSASAPHAAAAAVLVKGVFCSYTPAQIQGFLEERAIDLGAPGKDNLYGSGMLTLGEAPRVFSIAFDVSVDVASLTIDGTIYSSENLPKSFSWVEGSEHTCVAPSLISSGDEGTQYLFTSWSDGDTSTSRTVIASEDAMYTANYMTQHYLAAESDYGEPSGGGWYDEGTTAEVETDDKIGDDDTRYVFLNWLFDGDDKTNNPIYITMNAPHTAVAEYKTQHYLAVISNYGDPEGEDWYDEGTYAEIETDNLITDDGTRHVFENWIIDGDDRTGNPRSVTMDAPHTVSTTYQTQHYLTVNSGYGDPTGEDWYDEGETATASVTSPVGTIVRKVFTDWSGDFGATTPTANILMNEPKTITASWRTDYVQLYALIGGVVLVVVGGSALVVSQRRTKRHRSHRRTR